MNSFASQKIPTSRIATFDVFSIGLKKHHVAALLEFDVTESRQKLRNLKRSGQKVSLNGWLLKTIAKTLEVHPEAAAFLSGKHKLIMFRNINISLLVEKNINGKKVPIPLVIEKANEKSIEQITLEIENSKNAVLSEKDILLNKKPKLYEKLYYLMPGFLRRQVWHFMLGNPQLAYNKMGNIAVTSLGMVGKINGWFIHKSAHPLSFGLGSVIKKAVVINDEIKIREILNVTVLLDHDVIDGAPMVRFIKTLTHSIERGTEFS